MDIEEILAYRETLIETSKDNDGFISESSFLSSCMPLLNDAKLVDSEDYTESYYYNEKEKIKINGYQINDSEERLQLFVLNEESISINKTDEELKISQKSYYDNQFNKCLKFVTKSLIDKLFEEIQDADPVKVLVSWLSSPTGLEQFDVIEIFLVCANVTVETRGSVHQPKNIEFDSEIRTVKYNLDGVVKQKEILILKRLIDLNFLHKITITQGNRESLVVDFQKTFNYKLDCLKATEEKLYDTYLCALPATILYELYRNYSTRLLERNVRSFLSFTGVNKKIRQTIREKPERFLAYNNGLTITASEAIFENNGSLKILMLKDFQIVNGGQTTACIYFSRKDGIPIDKVIVAAKVNIVKSQSEDELDDLISDISLYSNSQKKVTSVDLSARSPYLLRIKSLSDSVPHPLGIKWFFESTRGQINTMLRFYSSRKAALEREYPKDRRISKEQLAKYYVSWGEQPYLVKKGGEKVFGIFLSELEKEYPTANDLDITFYEDIIGKSILFKELEAIYGVRNKSIGQIRSAVVPYTISLLYRYMNSGNNSSSNFKIVDIWKRNGLGDDFAHLLRNLMILVNKLLLENKLTDDVNESTKKPEQWNKIKDCQELRDFFKEEDSKKVLNKLKFTEEQLEKRYPALEHYKSETSSINSSTWFAIAKWAKENNKFGAAEKKFLFSVGKLAYMQKELSPKQAKWAHDLYTQAKNEGFEE